MGTIFKQGNSIKEISGIISMPTDFIKAAIQKIDLKDTKEEFQPVAVFVVDVQIT